MIESVNQPPRIMNSERSLTLPYRRDNTIQSPVIRACTRDITNCTQVPDFKLRVEFLRRDGTGLSEMIEWEILELCTWSSWTTSGEKISPYTTTWSRGNRGTCYCGCSRWATSWREREGGTWLARGGSRGWFEGAIIVIIRESEIQLFLFQERFNQSFIF